MTAMENKLVSRILEFANRNNIEVDEQYLDRLVVGERHELENALSSVFRPSGKIFFSEMGMPPDSYLLGLVSAYLGMLPGHQWGVNSVESDDGWTSAEVTLVNHNKEQYRYRLDEVNNSDWVPADFSEKLNIFTKDRVGLTFVELHSDDPYLLMVLPNDVADELLSILEEFGESY